MIYRNLFKFSNLNKISSSIVTYPYKFGGVGKLPDHKPQIKDFLREAFSVQNTDSFKQAYKAVLLSLHKKERQFLNGVLEPSLMSHITFKDVKLVCEDAPIEIFYEFVNVGLGVNFEKSKNGELQTMQEVSGSKGYINKSFLSNSMAGKLPIGKVPFLFSFSMYFKSKMKLVEDSAAVIDEQQIHQVLFQAEISRDIMELAKLIASMSASASGGKGIMAFSNNYKQLIGDQFDWQIGNIDRLLL